MWFSQNNRIPDFEWDYFAVFRAVFGEISPTVFARFVWHRGTYLPAAISARRSSTARRAAMSKSAFDCDA